MSIQAYWIKNSSIFLLLGILISFGAKGQYFVAGQHPAGAHYADVQPNHHIEVSAGCCMDSSESYTIDLDGNGFSDLNITVSAQHSTQWGQMNELIFEPLRNSRIAVVGEDTCYDNSTPAIVARTDWMAKSFQVGDTINAHEQWMNSTVHLFLNGWNCCFPTPLGHACSASAVQSDTAIFAIQVINGSDTTYAWLRLADLSANTFTVLDYASGRLFSALRRPTIASVSLYPNPVNDKLYIQASNEMKDLHVELYDPMQKLVLSKKLSSSFTSIDLSELPEGFYACILYDKAQMVHRQKLVRVR